MGVEVLARKIIFPKNQAKVRNGAKADIKPLCKLGERCLSHVYDDSAPKHCRLHLPIDSYEAYIADTIISFYHHLHYRTQEPCR
jgi:hypothetical protein